MNRHCSAQEIEYINVPVKDPKEDPNSGKWIFERHPILLPHRVISFLIDEVGITVSKQDIDNFWSHVKETQEPSFQLFEAEDCSWRIPLGLYGDAAQLFTQYRVEKQFAIFLNLLHWLPRATRFSRFLIYSIEESKILKGKTLNSIFRTVVWSCTALHHGKYPSRGCGGRVLSARHQQLAGRPISLKHPHLRFSVCEIRGDWLFHRDVWQWKCGWKSKLTCFRCGAMSTGDLANRYYNCSENSLWVKQELTRAEFISQRLKNQGICQLDAMSNYFSLWVVIWIVCNLPKNIKK